MAGSLSERVGAGLDLLDQPGAEQNGEYQGPRTPPPHPPTPATAPPTHQGEPHTLSRSLSKQDLI